MVGGWGGGGRDYVYDMLNFYEYLKWISEGGSWVGGGGGGDTRYFFFFNK